MTTKYATRLMMTVILFVSLLAPAFAAVPKTINYQGYLTDKATGNPLGTSSPVSVSMTFSLYNVEAGGAALWTETLGSVAVSNGIYNVVLGSAALLDLAFDEQYYLGIEIAADGEMIPRQQLASVPYAISAGSMNITGLTQSGCSNGQIMEWSAAAGLWVCANDIKTTGGIINATTGVIGNLGEDVRFIVNNGSLDGGFAGWFQVQPANADPALYAIAGAGQAASFIGGIDVSGVINSTRPDGTAPFTVLSLTKVANLNADMLDDKHAADFASGADVTALSDTVTSLSGTVTTLGTDVASLTGNVWHLTGNSGTLEGTHFIGTTDSQPFEVRAGNQRALRIEPSLFSMGSPNIIAGNSANSVTSGLSGATISGGGLSIQPNMVTADFGTVSGGSRNTAGNNATVSGGIGNNANSGGSVVSGGEYNTADGLAAAVGGGNGNTAHGDISTISGGSSNTASGEYSTVPGGQMNQAGGVTSFAAGYRATVRDAAAAGNTTGDQGTFIWSDAQPGAFVSTGDNQFLVRAQGGIGINKNNPATALDVAGTVTATAFIGDGSGITNIGVSSDRNIKEAFETVDPKVVLAKLAGMQVTSWKYKNEDTSIRHIGPMAQDFREAFGLGYSEKTIAIVDAQGIAFAAIQGLNKAVEEQKTEIAELKEQLARQEQMLRTLMTVFKVDAR